MPELIACIIAYNEEQLLPQCLTSIVNKVDRIILVEGRIATFPGNEVKSTDRTIEIACDYGCEVIMQSKPYINEAAMRSQYLVGNPGDWYLMIDADEKCMTDLPNIGDFPTGINAYAINVKMIGSPTQVFRPRLFRHIGDMEYREIHDALFSDGKLVSRPQDTPKLHSIWFAHYHMQREKIRRQQKHDYYQTGYIHEPERRKEWSMWNDG
jgi:hypothetical protein